MFYYVFTLHTRSEGKEKMVVHTSAHSSGVY